MAQTGTLLIRTYISNAQLPIPDAIVIVSVPGADGKQTLLSIQQTDQNGVAGPITLTAPDIAGSLTPGQNGSAFSSYTVTVEHPGYQLAVFDQLQIFPGIETVQDVPLIPLSPSGKDRQDLTTVTPQPL